MWVLYMMLGAPVMLAASVLRYTGRLLARHSPGQPALSSVAAAGGFVAQGQIMPAPEADALPVPALPAAPAAAAAPAGAVAVGLEAAGGQSVGAVSLPGSSVPLSATAVPEEHEVSGEELVSSSRGGSGSFIGPAGVAAAVCAVPPTPAPSLEVRDAMLSKPVLLSGCWQLPALLSQDHKVSTTPCCRCDPVLQEKYSCPIRTRWTDVLLPSVY